MIAKLSILLALLAPAAETPRHTAMIRYALIVGSNTGTDPVVGPMPTLQHAEREAATLHHSLIKFASFDSAPERTVLLAGARREDVRRAIDRIAAQLEADQKTFGDTRTLFAFFFTGHGLSERLLLADGPIYAKELAEMLRKIHADFTVGFFDACFSGSLTEHALAEKGVRPTPGLNIFRELPEDILTAEGSVWFVSSAPTEASYEDVALGGVFTHFFIEALERAEPEGPGITLDRIWSYARKETVLYTAARERAQTPQEVVTRLKASAPLYFSFPRKREAKLVLSSGVAGRFLLAYDGGELSEIIDKERGTPLELEVYAGPARMIMIGEGQVRAEESIVLAAGGTTLLEKKDETRRAAFGEEVQTLWKKGIPGPPGHPDLELTARLITMGTLLSVGAGYEYGVAREAVVAPRHMITVGLRRDGELFAASVRAGIGFGGERFAAWGYDVFALSADARAGLALRFADVRVALLAGVAGSRLEQRYDGGDQRRAFFSWAPTGGVEALVPVGGRWAIALSLDAGVLISRGAGASADNAASPLVKLGAMPMFLF